MAETTPIRLIPDPDYRPAQPVRLIPDSNYRPAQPARLVPDPNYRPAEPVRLVPDPGYRPPSLHAMYSGISARGGDLRARWCPICHSPAEDIREEMTASGPKWVCRACGHRW
ncbi:MAG: hypothetical protein IJL27_09060 [Firmicutes bacterium]|nr:hypothetical protein [Bacillota bacterium]